MANILTPTEREKLIKRHRKERDKRICDRIKAVLAYDDGYTYSEIARILLLDDETIRRHIEDYIREAKLATGNGGSKGKLTDREEKALTDHLHEVTYLYVKDICDYVCREYGRSYSISGMTQWLHSHGFRYKKPHGVPAKANQAAQESFIDYYEQLKASSGKNEPIYFADGVHPQHQTQLTYGWIPKGERKAIATTGRQKRLSFIGGICLDGHRFTYTQADRVNADSIVQFLHKLHQANRDASYIHVIWDNARYHYSEDVKRCADQLNIKLHYLPPYSPNLNPIERLWKLMHEHVRYNKYYESFADFSNATLEFFKSIGRKKRILRNRITDNFQTISVPAFAS